MTEPDDSTRSTPSTAGTPSGRRGLRAGTRRLLGLCGLGGSRAVGKLRTRADGRIRTTVLGVALAVALVVVVAGVGVGLAGDPVVHDSDVDYWVVPEDGGSSTLVGTDGPSLGSVHDASATVAADEDVAYVTPVLVEPMHLEGPTGEREYVLVVGVIGDEEATTIAGLPPSALSSGDPHFGAGEYDGPWTGEFVAGTGTASLLEAEPGDSIEPVGESTDLSTDGDPTFTVTGVHEAPRNPLAEMPVALVQLSELQAITGAIEGDRADQLLVSATDPAVREDLAGLYPAVSVETRSSLLAAASTDEELPLALTVSSLLVVLVVGPLFVGSTLGMGVLSDRRELATLAALGLGARSRATVVTAESVALVAGGGIVGTTVGVGLLVAGNRVAALVGPGPVGAVIPRVALTGLGVTAVLLALVVPVVAFLGSRVGRGGIPK